MNLYKITGRTHLNAMYPKIEYITAVNPAIAIKKFLSIHKSYVHMKTEVICQCSHIIPTKGNWKPQSI
jgi:hypothetical protein